MDPISEYQRWKQQGEQLRAQAKQAMEVRFRELLSEAAQIAENYRNDFGGPLKAPAGITAFRYKAAGKSKKAAKKVEKPAPAPVDPKVAALQKRRAQIQKKIEEAKAAAKPTKNLEDKLYEVEDDLRLAGGHAA
jgi:F0F1-type ATP synthase membrane subunit b/b'